MKSRKRPEPPVFACAALVLALVGCSPVPSANLSTDWAAPQILVGAGDIAVCGDPAHELTASLLDQISGTVFTVGDNAYYRGTFGEFMQCFHPSWGRHMSRMRPALGNHEYMTGSARGYFQYFGTRAGESDKGYYSYRLGNWHVVVLNSNCREVGGCSAGSPQERWLRADLAAAKTNCTVSYWHHPRFSSGFQGSFIAMNDLFRALYEAGAEIVISGHAHNYERFAPQNPDGKFDLSRGIRQFVIGTGGAWPTPVDSSAPNSEVVSNEALGVLKLALHADYYEWDFVAVRGYRFSDFGRALCH